MWIHAPLCKATFNNVLVTICGMQLWTISWLDLSSWKGRVTGEAYLRFLKEDLPRLLKDVPLNKRVRMYFQHDRAPSQSSREVRNFLNSRFPGRLIGLGGPRKWPARFPELIPLDYCVWGWMKELVYSMKVVTRDELHGRILGATDRIRNSQRKLQWTTHVVHNWAAACVAARDDIFENHLSTDHFKLKVISGS